MNACYATRWHEILVIEGAAQRAQEDTLPFASTVESLGADLINSAMTPIAFLPCS